MDPAAKQAALAERLRSGMYSDVRWLDECASTNTVLVDEVRRGSSDGAHGPTVLVTDRQTAGRGRLGRSWEAPVGSALTMSMRLPMPGAGHELAGLVPLAVGLAARSTVLALGADPDRVELKWPNDLMDPATGRKLAGILCEAVSLPGVVADTWMVVIGVGINLVRPDSVDGVVAERAQWVDQIGGSGVDPVVAAVTLADEVAQIVEELNRQPGSVLDRLRSECATIGKAVRVEQHARVLVGVAVGIGDDGSLTIQPEGLPEHESVHAGDVVHLR